MSASFDPYLKWLGIPPEEQPPSFYRLLGIKEYTDDCEVIQNAADRQMAHLRSFQMGDKAKLSQRLLNEIAAAKICLLDDKRRAKYDIELRDGGLSDVEDTPDGNSSRPALESTPVAAAAVIEPEQESKATATVVTPAVASKPADDPVAIGASAITSSRATARRTRVGRKKSDPVPVVIAGGIGLVLLCGALYAMRSGTNEDERPQSTSKKSVAAAPATKDQATRKQPVAPPSDFKTPATPEPPNVEPAQEIESVPPKDELTPDDPNSTSADEDRFDGGFKLPEAVTEFPIDDAPFKRDPVSPKAPDVEDEPVVDEPAVDEPAVDVPSTDDPPVDKPVVSNPALDGDLAELLTGKGLTQERDRWIAPEELELRKQMANLKVLEDRFLSLSALVATRGRQLAAMKSQLVRERKRLKELISSSERSSERGSGRGSRSGLRGPSSSTQQKLVDKLEKQITAAETYLEKAEAARKELYVTLVDQLIAAGASIKASNEKYTALAKDDEALGAIETLGDKQGPSPTLNSATFTVARLKKRFPVNNVPRRPQKEKKAAADPLDDPKLDQEP
jgi:hypothetical protein